MRPPSRSLGLDLAATPFGLVEPRVGIWTIRDRRGPEVRDLPFRVTRAEAERNGGVIRDLAPRTAALGARDRRGRGAFQVPLPPADRRARAGSRGRVQSLRRLALAGQT